MTTQLYKPIYDHIGGKRKSSKKSSKKSSRKSSRKSSKQLSRSKKSSRKGSRRTKRTLPPALVEYRKLSNKVLNAIAGLKGLPDTDKDGASMKTVSPPMMKIIGKFLREHNRDVDKVIKMLSVDMIKREFEQAKKEIAEARRKH